MRRGRMRAMGALGCLFVPTAAAAQPAAETLECSVQWEAGPPSVTCRAPGTLAGPHTCAPAIHADVAPSAGVERVLLCGSGSNGSIDEHHVWVVLGQSGTDVLASGSFGHEPEAPFHVAVARPVDAVRDDLTELLVYSEQLVEGSGRARLMLHKWRGRGLAPVLTIPLLEVEGGQTRLENNVSIPLDPAALDLPFVVRAVRQGGRRARGEVRWQWSAVAGQYLRQGSPAPAETASGQAAPAAQRPRPAGGSEAALSFEHEMGGSCTLAPSASGWSVTCNGGSSVEGQHPCHPSVSADLVPQEGAETVLECGPASWALVGASGLPLWAAPSLPLPLGDPMIPYQLSFRVLDVAPGERSEVLLDASQGDEGYHAASATLWRWRRDAMQPAFTTMLFEEGPSGRVGETQLRVAFDAHGRPAIETVTTLRDGRRTRTRPVRHLFSEARGAFVPEGGDPAAFTGTWESASLTNPNVTLALSVDSSGRLQGNYHEGWADPRAGRLDDCAEGRVSAEADPERNRVRLRFAHTSCGMAGPCRESVPARTCTATLHPAGDQLRLACDAPLACGLQRGPVRRVGPAPPGD